MNITYIGQYLARKARNPTLALIAAVATTSAVPASAAIITTGLTLNFDAGLDNSANGIWESTESLQTHNWQLGSNITLDNDPITGLPGITGAYVFPTSGTNSDSDKATAATYETIVGDPTDAAASFEIWFRPESLTNGDQVLWETGAALDGSSFTIIDGNRLRFTLKNDANNLVVETPITQSTEFIQAVATYDRNNPGTTDTLSLYINGVFDSTDIDTNVNDWAGPDSSGIGGRNGFGTGGDNAGGVSLNFGTFEGEIAIFRFYELALSGEEVEQNFEAIASPILEIPEPSSALGLLVFVSLSGGSIFLQNRKDNQ